MQKEELILKINTSHKEVGKISIIFLAVLIIILLLNTQIGKLMGFEQKDVLEKVKIIKIYRVCFISFLVLYSLFFFYQLTKITQKYEVKCPHCNKPYHKLNYKNVLATGRCVYCNKNVFDT